MTVEVTNTKIKFDKQKQKFGYDFMYAGERYRKFVWTSERKATSALLKFINDLKEGVTSSNIIFSELCDKYYAHISGSINQNTLTTKKQVINKHIMPTFKDRKVRSITISELSAFLSNLLLLKYVNASNESKFYSNEFLDRIQTQLWGVFEFANIHGYITTNPTLKLNRVHHNIYQEKKKFYRVPANDAYKVVDFAHNKQSKLMILLSLDHGMRPSEIAGLDIKDINFENKIIHIRQAWKSKEKELTATKNGKDRYNATTQRVLDAVRNLLDEYNQFGGYNESMSLFGLVKRPAATTMETWKNDAIKAAGVKHFSWYDMRHTHVTDLLEAGFKPYQVAERLGHDEIQTLDYAIVEIDEQFDMIDALEKMRSTEDEKWQKSDKEISKDEILEEINRLMQLLK